ncbi:MAG: tripartite tricarboxylate transporter substrate binding protein [Hyphomicrobiales bacterium]|nr:tripartite tricarboxylate transporter substrate binding protein [Hyphomicrobiales bacterium]
MPRQAHLLFCAAAVCAALALFSTARANDFPNHFIRILVGPGPDIIARFFAPKITEEVRQDVVIEPRPGAGGIIAAQAVATAPPDGYLLLMATASYTIGTALKTMPHDLRTQYAPIGLAATAPFVLVVHPSVPARSVEELIALARKEPGKLNYSSSGIGTPPHLAGELFKSMAGLDIVHVPFREANSALSAVVSGSVQFMFAIASVAKAQVDAGTVRALGVSTLAPSNLVPGMPLIAQVLPGYQVLGWNGFVAPAGTPADRIAKLSAGIRRGLDDEDLRKRLQAAGYDPAARNTPEQFADFIRADTQKWIDLVAKANIKAR